MLVNVDLIITKLEMLPTRKIKRVESLSHSIYLVETMATSNTSLFIYLYSKSGSEMHSAPAKQIHSPIIRPRTPTDDAINSADWSIGGQASPTSTSSSRGDVLGAGGYSSAPLMGRPLSPAFHGSAPNLSPSLIPARPQSPSIAPAR